MAKSSSALISTVAGGVLTAAILGAASLIPGAWAWFIDLISGTWVHLNNTSELPNWGLYLLALGSFMLVFRLIWEIIINFNSDNQTYLSYTEDSYFGATWRWQYSKGIPFDIWAFCSRCDTVLVYSYHRELYGEVHTQLSCETCNSTVLTQLGDKDYLVKKVHRQIDRKLRTEEWKHVQLNKK